MISVKPNYKTKEATPQTVTIAALLHNKDVDMEKILIIFGLIALLGWITVLMEDDK